MAASPVNRKSGHHARSNSLPTRTHPLISEFNEQLSRLRDSEATTSSSTSICQKLNGLQDLHDCVDKLLLSLQFTQALAHEQQEKWVNELLDGSLRLLEVCDLAREVERCLSSRMVVKKAMQKALKGMQNKFNYKNNEYVGMVSMLKEVEAGTLMVFESLLTFIGGSKLQSKLSSWFLVSKLVHPERACEGDEEAYANEFEKVDAAVRSLVVSRKTSKSDQTMHVENVQNCMGKLESSILDLQEVLECLSRHLVKTRVSLLNTFNH
ncbi:hypothetical protein FH972_019395 [Carpinus fangiana]|uniref:Uncharacterized protein n=1 Tax=Carpinus fangiana TaxID=176857 RepID=A0A5N6RRI0_9ROSI|nr:hypothetical protein FH972_019395 [Carpinus fangiana]